MLDPDDGVFGFQGDNQLDQLGNFMISQTTRNFVKKKKLCSGRDRFCQFQPFAIEKSKVTGWIVGIGKQAGFGQHIDRVLLGTDPDKPAPYALRLERSRIHSIV